MLLPITVYEGAILDGRNRYRACKLASVEPRFEQYGGDTPAAFVARINKDRRHLTPSQLAASAVEALPFFEKEAKTRKVESGKSTGRGNKKVSQIIDTPLGRANERAMKSEDILRGTKTGETESA